MRATLTAIAKRESGVANKVPVFGLLKCSGKVHVVIVQNDHSDALIPIIREKIKPDSIVYFDSFKSYDVLNVSGFRHMRINHFVLFADQRNHISVDARPRIK
jgi:transposase